MGFNQKPNKRMPIGLESRMQKPNQAQHILLGGSMLILASGMIGYVGIQKYKNGAETNKFEAACGVTRLKEDPIAGDNYLALEFNSNYRGSQFSQNGPMFVPKGDFFQRTLYDHKTEVVGFVEIPSATNVDNIVKKYMPDASDNLVDLARRVSFSYGSVFVPFALKSFSQLAHDCQSTYGGI